MDQEIEMGQIVITSCGLTGSPINHTNGCLDPPLKFDAPFHIFFLVCNLLRNDFYLKTLLWGYCLTSIIQVLEI